RGRVLRGDRGPPPARRPAPLRVARLRRVGDGVPAQEALTFPRMPSYANAAIAAGPVIRVRGLIKRYGDLVAVDGIDFDVAAGEVFGLLGPNGAGKTTTGESLEGLRSPDGGQAMVLGVDVADGADSLKPRIGVSLQTASMYPKLTVVEIIDLFRSFYQRSRPTDELVEMLEL